MVVKLVVGINYLPGRQQEYNEKAKGWLQVLLAPEELKKASVWSNWVGGTPHRVIEFEFEDMKAYERYFSREDVRKITHGEFLDITTNQEAKILDLIYTPK